jgi:hypothetical protein
VPNSLLVQTLSGIKANAANLKIGGDDIAPHLDSSAPGLPPRSRLLTASTTNMCLTSVADPDPYVFGPPGSCSEFFNHEAKIVRKPLIPTVF